MQTKLRIVNLFAASLLWASLISAATQRATATRVHQPNHWGLASWYGKEHQGRKMANGQRFRPAKAYGGVMVGAAGSENPRGKRSQWKVRGRDRNGSRTQPQAAPHPRSRKPPPTSWATRPRGLAPVVVRVHAREKILHGPCDDCAIRHGRVHGREHILDLHGRMPRELQFRRKAAAWSRHCRRCSRSTRSRRRCPPAEA